VTTRTAPLLTPSRVTAAPELVWDCGKMPTKRGKSAKVFRAEQAAKAAHHQELYAAAGLSSLSESVSSKLVPPVQFPPGLKSLKSAQQTMATWLSPQATTPPESPHLKRGSGNKRVQVNSPDPSSYPAGISGFQALGLGGQFPPPWTTSSSKLGRPLPHACPRRSLPPRPFPPTCL
jgi:hypothetical protein